MKWTLNALLALILMIVPSAAALAAEAARVDRSEVFVWGFLGICAIIVAAQLAPILRDALMSSAEEEELEEKTVTT